MSSIIYSFALSQIDDILDFKDIKVLQSHSKDKEGFHLFFRKNKGVVFIWKKWFSKLSIGN